MKKATKKNIVILNGDQGTGEKHFTAALDKLMKDQPSNIDIKIYQLQEMKLKSCVGCWSCWWKTPGQCVIKDNASEIFEAVINADLYIFASPLYVGFTSATLKTITDRFVTLLHPYVELRNKESHHMKRYDHYPDFGVIIGKEPDTDEEDMTIIQDLYDRFALNFHCTNRFVSDIYSESLKNNIYETCNI